MDGPVVRDLRNTRWGHGSRGIGRVALADLLSTRGLRRAWADSAALCFRGHYFDRVRPLESGLVVLAILSWNEDNTHAVLIRISGAGASDDATRALIL